MFEAIIERLRGETLSPQPWEPHRGAWRYTTRTMARTFHSVIADAGPAVIEYTAADFFSDSLAAMFLERAVALAASGWPEPGRYQIAPLGGAEASFYAVVIQGPKSRWRDAPELVVSSGFPIYACELAPDEHHSDLAEVRRRCVDAIDWRRMPQPRIRYRYAAATGAGVGRFRFANLDEILTTLPQMTADDDWIEIENFERLSLRFVRRGPAFRLQEGQYRAVALQGAPLRAAIEDFCCGRPNLELQLAKGLHS